MRAISLVNLVRMEVGEIKWGRRTEGGGLTQAKDGSYVSLEQEAHSVEATQIHFAEKSSFVANNLEGRISRQDFLSFDRL